MNPRKPDFLIIGAAKCGTSSIASALDMHPDIFVPPQELHFFTTRHKKGEDWYLSNFQVPEKILGEKSPSYLFILECHQRIHRFIPGAKLVILLRDPVVRAYSNWNMRYNKKRLITEGLGYNHRQNKPDRLPSLDFEAITDYYIERGPHDPRLYERPLDVIHRSLYIDQIEHLMQFFKREHLHIIITEEYFADEQKGYRELCRFLNVPPYTPPTFEIKLKGEYQHPLPEQAAKKLREYYRPYNQRLFQFLGRPVNVWQ